MLPESAETRIQIAVSWSSNSESIWCEIGVDRPELDGGGDVAEAPESRRSFENVEDAVLLRETARDGPGEGGCTSDADGEIPSALSFGRAFRIRYT